MDKSGSFLLKLARYWLYFCGISLVLWLRVWKKTLNHASLIALPHFRDGQDMWLNKSACNRKDFSAFSAMGAEIHSVRTMSQSTSCHFIDDLSLQIVGCQRHPNPLIEVEPSWYIFILCLSIFWRIFTAPRFVRYSDLF